MKQKQSFSPTQSPSERKYASSFVDNLHENVLRNIYSLDFSYDMGKLRITVQTQVKLKWED